MILSAYLDQMPRLQAVADLRMVNAVAAGTGQMPKDARQRYLADLQRQARSRNDARRAVRPSSPAELRRGLAGLGIGVHVPERAPAGPAAPAGSPAPPDEHKGA